MDAATISALAAAVTAILGAIATLITALKNSRAIEAVHRTVNGNLTVAQARTEQLTAALTEASVPVPASVPVASVPPAP